MRHAVKGRKLGRTSSHRLALFRNQLASLVDKERIITTLPKAKELRPIAEKIVTQGKRDTVHARRQVGRWIGDRDLIKKLFDHIAPRFINRPGGYLRIVKLGPRPGDGAEMAVIQFVDFELDGKGGETKAPEVKRKKQGAKAKAKKAAAPAEEQEKKPKRAAKAKAQAAEETDGAPKAAKKAVKKPKAEKDEPAADE